MFIFKELEYLYSLFSFQALRLAMFLSDRKIRNAAAILIRLPAIMNVFCILPPPSFEMSLPGGPFVRASLLLMFVSYRPIVFEMITNCLCFIKMR